MLYGQTYIRGKCIWREGSVPKGYVFWVSAGKSSKVRLTMISIHPTPHLHIACSWKTLVWALQSGSHITMSIIFCLPYWDSFAFYLIISTTEPALTLSFQNHLRILFLDHFLESQAQGDLTRHFAGVSVMLLSDGPSFLLVSTSFKNVYLPRSSICWWHLLLRIQRIKLIPLPVTSGISQDGPSCAVVTSNPLGGSAQGAFLIYKSYVGCLSGLCSSESLSNTVWWKFYRDTCFHKHHNWIRSI